MTFTSIMFPPGKEGAGRPIPEDSCFLRDLNLDQVVEAMTAGRQDYDLKPFFHLTLTDEDTIRYRQEVISDLEDAGLLALVKAFSERLRAMRWRLSLADGLTFRYNKEGWFLEAACVYCEALREMGRGLAALALKSRGFSAFRDHLLAYIGSPSFVSLWTEAKALKADLENVKYCLLIKGDRVTVRRYEGEADYSVEVERAFAKFKKAEVQGSKMTYGGEAGLNHVEEKILGFVTLLYPEVFARLDRFCAERIDFLDEKVIAFEREVQFYLACLEYVAPLKSAGLPFCYPRVLANTKEVCVKDGFDLALARRLVTEKTPVVLNDFFLKGRERVLVVTGPNQGGKTTFARMFGQEHYLALLGLPVPGREASLFLCDGIFTHFEKEEAVGDLRGRLKDDLVRIHAILAQATARSVVILNEIFTSTTLKDAVVLSRMIMERIVALDAPCVWVTFLDELASHDERTVSMVSTVDPENPTVRTFKILRRQADGMAYALSLAEKYRLTYRQIRERLSS